jgi:hypothetical protein
MTSKHKHLPLETHSQCFFQLNACGCSPYVPPSLTRGWVNRLLLLLVLASAVILGSKSRGTHDHILLSRIQTHPTWRARSSYLYPPSNRVVQLYPQDTGFYCIVLNLHLVLLTPPRGPPQKTPFQTVPPMLPVDSFMWRRISLRLLHSNRSTRCTLNKYFHQSCRAQQSEWLRTGRPGFDSR